MAEPSRPDPSLLIIALFSRHESLFGWAKTRLAQEFGPIAEISPLFSFHQTTYYESTMGPNLRKQFFAFADLVESDCLADVKLRTNLIEQEAVDRSEFAETRPINLDPGLLQLGKFLLATTKDQAHRIYLKDGIFAEVTLQFQDKAFHPWPWTYADYCEPHVRKTLKEFRRLYKQLLNRIRGVQERQK